jgi:hypothetical protein
LIGSWPSPFAGRRGKKLLVVRHQLSVHPLPLSQEEVTHHVVARGERLGFEMIESGLLFEEAGVEGGNIDVIQVGHALCFALVIDASDDDLKAGHAVPPNETDPARYLMIRGPPARSLLPTNQAQRFCALTNFVWVSHGVGL